MIGRWPPLARPAGAYKKRPPRAWRRWDFEKRAVGIGGTWDNLSSLILIEVVTFPHCSRRSPSTRMVGLLFQRLLPGAATRWPRGFTRRRWQELLTEGCTRRTLATTKRSGGRSNPSRQLQRKVKDAKDAEEVLRLLNKNEELFNVFVVSTGMSQLRRFDKPWEALGVFEFAMSRGIQQNVFTFSAAISACERLGDWKKALEIFGELKQRRLKPDIITYNALISA